MAWCPKCKNEYVDGITRCADCDVDLVDELEEEKEVEYIHLNDIEHIDEIIDYLHKASIDSAELLHLDEEDSDVISVDKKQFTDARLHIAVYLKNEAAQNISLENEDIEDIPTDTEDLPEDNEPDLNNDTSCDSDNSYPKFSSTYTKLSDKYEDVKSSAYTLLIVGTIGFIAMLLEAFGIYNIPISSHTKWLFYTVMGGIFIAFIISGIISAMHAKHLKIEADKENQTIDEILSWFRENYSRETVDCSIDTDTQDELLYFNRAEFIKNEIMHQFEDADEPLVDSLIENIYQELFESAE